MFNLVSKLIRKKDIYNHVLSLNLYLKNYLLSFHFTCTIIYKSIFNMFYRNMIWQSNNFTLTYILIENIFINSLRLYFNFL